MFVFLSNPPALPRNSNTLPGPWTYHQLRIYFRLKPLAVVLASVGGTSGLKFQVADGHGEWIEF